MTDDADNNKTTASPQTGSATRVFPVSKPLLALLGSSLLLFILAAAHFGVRPIVAPDQSENDYGKMLSGRPYWTYDATPRTIPDLAVMNASGATLHLSDFKGHYVIVNIWETNCSGTPHVLPGMNNLSTHFSDDQPKIVNLAEDRGGIKAVQDYYKANGYRNLAAYADPTTNARYTLGLRGIPSFMLLNPEGKEIVRLEGAMDFNLPENVAWLQSYLQQ